MLHNQTDTLIRQNDLPLIHFRSPDTQQVAYRGGSLRPTLHSSGVPEGVGGSSVLVFSLVKGPPGQCRGGCDTGAGYFSGADTGNLVGGGAASSGECERGAPSRGRLAVGPSCQTSRFTWRHDTAPASRPNGSEGGTGLKSNWKPATP